MSTTKPKPIAISDLAYELGFWSLTEGHLFYEAIGEPADRSIWHNLISPEQADTYRARVRSWRESGPRSCIRCRQVEPNSFLLDNNHGGSGGRFWSDGMCTAQWLTRNHVSYDTAKLGHSVLPRNNQPDRPTTRQGRASAIAELRRDIDRATELWAHRPDAGWLDDARHVLTLVDPPAPGHRQVHAETDDTALFEVTA